jgi:hypothetical protein
MESMREHMQVRWERLLPRPTRPGVYWYGRHLVQVTQEDIAHADRRPDAVFEAVRQRSLSPEQKGLFLLTSSAHIPQEER